MPVAVVQPARCYSSSDPLGECRVVAVSCSRNLSNLHFRREAFNQHQEIYCVFRFIDQQGEGCTHGMSRRFSLDFVPSKKEQLLKKSTHFGQRERILDRVGPNRVLCCRKCLWFIRGFLNTLVTVYSGAYCCRRYSRYIYAIESLE